ncbi:autoinducer-2 (AI-2) modifying protein LsrG [Shimia sp. SK013]|nr:autoinducer-2 (AI-2) modifying protein LsrG [Shimia sp. SK013]
MYVVCVTFTLKAEAKERFMPLMLAQARNSLALEPECLQFDVCSNEQTHEVFLYEIYASEDAFQVHLATTHFKDFDVAVRDLIADKAVSTFGDVVIGS